MNYLWIKKEDFESPDDLDKFISLLKKYKILVFQTFLPNDNLTKLIINEVDEKNLANIFNEYSNIFFRLEMTSVLEFSIHGMTCNSCVRNIESVFSKRHSIHCQEIILKDDFCRVWYNKDLISPSDIYELVENMGFEVSLLPDKKSKKSSIKLLIHGRRIENDLLDSINQSLGTEIIFSLSLNTFLFIYEFKERLDKTQLLAQCNALNYYFDTNNMANIAILLDNDNQLILPIHELHCQSCVRKIETHFRNDFLAKKCRLINDNKLKVSLTEKTLTLEIHEKDFPNIEEIKNELNEIGFKLFSESNNPITSSINKTLERVVNKPKAIRNLDELSKKIIEDESEKKCHIKITGMTCSSCVYLIENHLSQIKGIKKVLVALLAMKAEVKYDPFFVSPDKVVSAINEIGFCGELIETNNTIYTISFKLNELSSRLTSESIQSSLKRKEGIELVQFDYAKSKLSIQYDREVIGPRDLYTFITDQGCDIEIFQDYTTQNEHQTELHRWRTSFIVSLVFCIPIMLIMMISMVIWDHDMSSACLPDNMTLSHVPETEKAHNFEPIIFRGMSITNLSMFLLATPVQIFCTKLFYKHAWKSMIHGMANMDVLVALATSISYTYSVIILSIAIIFNFKYSPKTFFETSVMLTTFISLGRWLEKIAKGRTSEVLTHLLTLKATEARVLFDGAGVALTREAFLSRSKEISYNEKKINIDLVQESDLIKILPGEKIPVDAKVIHGSSSCDESMITGESLPVNKVFGHDVIGGSINMNSLIIVEATHVGNESALNQIVNLVQTAQMSKAKIQQRADIISAYFIPTICLLSSITLFVWLLIGKYKPSVLPGYKADCTNVIRLNIENAFLFALTVLSIACPCSLGLATPTAVMVATGIGAANGILIKGGEPLENLKKINTILFDKTGTITIGRPQVCRITLFNPIINNVPVKLSINRFLLMIASAENTTQHPIGNAIQRLITTIRTAQFHNVLKDPLSSLAKIIDSRTEIGMGVECTLEVKAKDCHPDDVFPKYTRAELYERLKVDKEDPNIYNQEFDLDYSSRVNVDTKFYHTKEMKEDKFQWADLNKTDSYRVHIGSLDWLKMCQVQLPERAIFNDSAEETISGSFLTEIMEQDERNAKTVILIAIEKVLVGMISVDDPIKPDAALTVFSLKKRGIDVGMITGDNSFTARTIARKVGIDRVYSKVLPVNKVEKVKMLQNRRKISLLNHSHSDSQEDFENNNSHNVSGRGRSMSSSMNKFHRAINCLCTFVCFPVIKRCMMRIANVDINKRDHYVAMIGDGINDSPALAQADIGIAIGRGADVAVEAADIVLLRDKLVDIIVAIDLSRKTVNRIKLNFLAATLYNFVSVPIAAGILIPFNIMLSPWIASVCMVLSSLSVISLSLLLKKWKKPTESSLITNEFINRFTCDNQSNASHNSMNSSNTMLSTDGSSNRHLACNINPDRVSLINNDQLNDDPDQPLLYI